MLGPTREGWRPERSSAQRTRTSPSLFRRAGNSGCRKGCAKRTVNADGGGVFAPVTLVPRRFHKGLLSFPRRPAISPGTGAAHEHRPLSVAQAVSLKKGLDRELVVDNSKGTRPVRTP